METETNRRILAEAMIESLRDLWEAARGTRSPEEVRRVTVADAAVDDEATMLSLPSRLIRPLGLEKQYTKWERIGNDIIEATVYDPVRLTIRGRACTMDVWELPDHFPVLIGRLPLLQLDLVVDPRGRTLIGNPAHGGEQMLELY
jgi:hypothetical protein